MEQKYEYVEELGSGGYGSVYLCNVKDNPGRQVAVKRFKDAHTDPEVMRLALREVRLLKLASHRNIVKLIEAFRSKSGRVYLVMEFIERTITADLLSQPRGLPAAQVKLFMWQLIQGVGYLHKMKANILVSNEGVVKLCDFGFARSMHPQQTSNYSSYVVTRWYRSPEVLLGDKYGPGIDIWALGCIFAELTTGRAILPGKTNMDQLSLTIRLLGCLSERQTQLMQRDPQLSALGVPTYRNIVSFKSRFPNFSPDMIELLDATLQPDPAKRMTAVQLLSLPYFHDVTVLMPTLATVNPGAFSVDKDNLLFDESARHVAVQACAECCADTGCTREVVPTMGAGSSAPLLTTETNVPDEAADATRSSVPDAANSLLSVSVTAAMPAKAGGPQAPVQIPEEKLMANSLSGTLPPTAPLCIPPLAQAESMEAGKLKLSSFADVPTSTPTVATQQGSHHTSVASSVHSSLLSIGVVSGQDSALSTSSPSLMSPLCTPTAHTHPCRHEPLGNPSGSALWHTPPAAAGSKTSLAAAWHGCGRIEGGAVQRWSGLERLESSVSTGSVLSCWHNDTMLPTGGAPSPMGDHLDDRPGVHVPRYSWSRSLSLSGASVHLDRGISSAGLLSEVSSQLLSGGDASITTQESCALNTVGSSLCAASPAASPRTVLARGSRPRLLHQHSCSLTGNSLSYSQSSMYGSHDFLNGIHEAAENASSGVTSSASHSSPLATGFVDSRVSCTRSSSLRLTLARPQTMSTLRGVRRSTTSSCSGMMAQHVNTAALGAMRAALSTGGAIISRRSLNGCGSDGGVGSSASSTLMSFSRLSPTVVAMAPSGTAAAGLELRRPSDGWQRLNLSTEEVGGHCHQAISSLTPASTRTRFKRLSIAAPDHGGSMGQAQQVANGWSTPDSLACTALLAVTSPHTTNNQAGAVSPLTLPQPPAAGFCSRGSFQRDYLVPAPALQQTTELVSTQQPEQKVAHGPTAASLTGAPVLDGPCGDDKWAALAGYAPACAAPASEVGTDRCSATSPVAEWLSQPQGKPERPSGGKTLTMAVRKLSARIEAFISRPFSGHGLSDSADALGSYAASTQKLPAVPRTISSSAVACMTTLGPVMSRGQASTQQVSQGPPDLSMKISAQIRQGQW